MPDNGAPDWPAYVRQNLQLCGFRPERESEIVEEIAQQLEEAYHEVLRAGGTETLAARPADRIARSGVYYQPGGAGGQPAAVIVERLSDCQAGLGGMEPRTPA